MKVNGTRDADENFWDNFRSLEGWGSKAHTDCPYVVITDKQVNVHDRTKDLLAQNYPDDTLVIKTWPGQWRTDYFNFTIKELKKQLS